MAGPFIQQNYCRVVDFEGSGNVPFAIIFKRTEAKVSFRVGPKEKIEP
jgi:hypothetical protein